MATRRFPPVKYITPDLEGNRLAYRGRRYWLVELADGASFQCVDKEEADYVVFDRLDDAPIAATSEAPRHSEGCLWCSILGTPRMR